MGANMEKNKKRLYYITSNIAPFRVDLLDELAQYFEKVALCYYEEIEKGVNPLYVKKRPENVELICLKGLSTKQAFKELCNADYLIFDGYTGKEKIKMILACIIKKKNYMISIDGIIPKQKKDNKIKKTIKSILIGGASVVFSTNKYTNEIIKEIAPKVYIYRHIFSTLRRDNIEKNGSDHTEILSAYGIRMDKKRILFIGKFLITKGVREFVECSKKTDYEFIMVGGTKDELKKYNLEIGENVKVIPFLEKEDILKLMSSSDVFVLPTYTDVWGLVIIEALMSKIPIVTTELCNAGKEFISEGKNGYIVPIMDSDAIYDAIQKALELDRASVRKYNLCLMGDYTIENAAYRMQKEIYEKG